MELILNNLKNKAKRCNINTWERKKLSSSSFLTWQKLYSYRTNRQFVGRVTFWAVHYSKLPCFVTWPHATATQLKTPGLSLICGSKLLALNCTIIQKVFSFHGLFHQWKNAPYLGRICSLVGSGFVTRMKLVDRAWKRLGVVGRCARHWEGGILILSNIEEKMILPKMRMLTEMAICFSIPQNLRHLKNHGWNGSKVW